MQIEDDSPKVKLPPPLVFLGALIAGIGFEHALGGPWLDVRPALRLTAAILLLPAGIALILRAAGLFRKAGTNIEPWRSSTAIVSSGPYRWSRNPIYLGMAVIYLGLALAFDSLIALLLLPVVLIVIQTQVIAREERYLEAKFGDAYRDYKARVRRWI